MQLPTALVTVVAGAAGLVASVGAYQMVSSPSDTSQAPVQAVVTQEADMTAATPSTVPSLKGFEKKLKAAARAGERAGRARSGSGESSTSTSTSTSQSTSPVPAPAPAPSASPSYHDDDSYGEDDGPEYEDD